MKLNEPTQNEIDRWPKISGGPKQERNWEIVRLRNEGRTFEDIAHRFRLTHQAIQKIVKNPLVYKKKEPPKKEPKPPKEEVKTTKGGIILNTEDYKSYTDYLKASDYKKEYKQFCIRWYNSHKLSDVVNDEIDAI